MALAEQFDLLELIQRDKAETWLAFEKTTKRRLLLHRFREDTGLRQRLLAMRPEDLIMLVAAEREGEFYVVVTHDQPPLRDFGKWVRERSASKPVPKVSDEPFDPDRTQLMSPPPRKEPSEFTRMFQIPPAPPPEEKAKAALTGEFTKLFEASNGLDKKPASKQEPGEFTKLFYAPPKPSSEPTEPAPPPASIPRAKEDGPGEFTRTFESPFATPPPELEATLYREPLLAPPQPRKMSDGEFTKVFGPLSHIAEPERPKFDSGRATGIFEKLQSPANTVNTAPPAAAGPGDYTRMFQASTAPAPLEAPAAEAATKPNDEPKAPVAAGGSSNIVALTIVLALLVIAAAGLLLYFVLKR